MVRDTPPGSPSWFPLLFVTIACGAVSGFHCLVSSGTTAKQLHRETDARYIGYFGAVSEGALALAAILACTAGAATSSTDWQALYASFASASNQASTNFVNGVASFTSNLGVPDTIGAIFAAIVVISFAATTLDTGVRLQRYIVQEIAEVAGARALSRSATFGSVVAVVIPLVLALLPGGGHKGFAYGVLWQLFGTTNQLTAGLALAVIAVWVTKSHRNPFAVVLPLVFLLVMTTWALLVNLGTFLSQQQWALAPLDLMIFGLAVWLIIEAALALRTAWQQRTPRVRHRSEPDGPG